MCHPGWFSSDFGFAILSSSGTLVTMLALWDEVAEGSHVLLQTRSLLGIWNLSPGCAGTSVPSLCHSWHETHT